MPSSNKSTEKRFAWVKMTLPKDRTSLSADDAMLYSIEELVQTKTPVPTAENDFVESESIVDLNDEIPFNPDDFIHIDDFDEPKASSSDKKSQKKNKPSSTVTVPKLKKIPVETAQKQWSDFSLNERLIERLDANGFAFPTPIQANVLQQATHYHRDVIGCAPTGSGKTLAFGIPVLNQYYTKDTPFLALILSPTRELAHQIRTALLDVEPSLHIAAITGGLSALKQERLLLKNPHIIVATPGRLWDFMSKNSDLADSLKKVKFLIIDEADRMVQGGHFRELRDILARVSLNDNNADTRSQKRKRQTLVFSATLLEDNQMRRLADGNKAKFNKNGDSSLTTLVKLVEFYDKEPLYVNLSSSSVLAAGVFESKIDCLKNEKDIALYYLLLRYTGRSIVFVNSIDAIRRLVPIFGHLTVNVIGLHAELKQKQRLSRLEQFKSSTNGVLIATDVAARGLDIPQVEQVIHYQVPRSPDIYVHRSGRTARGAGSEGSSILLLAPDEMQLYKKICLALQKEDGLPNFPLDRAVFSRLRERVDLARELDKLVHISSKADHDDRWMKKAALEADIYLSSDSEDEDRDKQRKGKSTSDSRTATIKSKLSTLLNLPIIPKGISLKYLTGNVQKSLAGVFMSNGASIEAGSMPTFPNTTSSSDLKRLYETHSLSGKSSKRRKQ